MVNMMSVNLCRYIQMTTFSLSMEVLIMPSFRGYAYVFHGPCDKHSGLKTVAGFPLLDMPVISAVKYG